MDERGLFCRSLFGGLVFFGRASPRFFFLDFFVCLVVCLVIVSLMSRFFVSVFKANQATIHSKANRCIHQVVAFVSDAL